VVVLLRALHQCVRQIVNRSCQLSKGARSDGIFPVLEVSYRTLCNAGLAREELSGKLLGPGPNFVEVFRIHYSLVFSKRLMHWIQGSRFGDHGQVGSAPPTSRSFSANVTKLASNNASAHKHADSLAGACTAVRRAKLTLGARQKRDQNWIGQTRKPTCRRFGRSSRPSAYPLCPRN